MDQQRFDKIDKLLQSTLALAPEDRVGYLERVCGDDEELRREVVELLGKEEEAARLESQAAARVTELIRETNFESLVGQRIGRYRVEAWIGAGGMGEVYKAWDEELGRFVALKTLSAEFTADSDWVRRFEQEARAVSALNHPNIITIFEIVHDRDSHFIVSEYVEGRTLRSMLTDPETQEPRGLGVNQTINIAIQLTSALKAAHTAWIIHRDIKPENVMRREDGLVKALDFGIAKLEIERGRVKEEEGETAGRLDGETEREGNAEINQRSISPPPRHAVQPSDFTAPGTIMGTASYMSPEQARGEQLDGRTDLYSLGVVLYEMVAGKRLFDRNSRFGAAPTPDDIDAGSLHGEFDRVPKALQRIIRKLLRSNRDERYSSASELLDDLNRLKRRMESRTARRMVGLSALIVFLALTLAALTAFFSVSEVWEPIEMRDGHTAAARRVIFSPAGGPNGWLLVSVGEDNKVIVWDYARRERLKTFTDHKGWVTAAAFSPDGKWFATAGADDQVIVWDAAQLKKVTTLPGFSGVVREIAFSADGKYLVAPGGSDVKNIWTVGNWEKIRTIRDEGSGAFFLISPDGRAIITPGWTTYDLDTGQPSAPKGVQGWAWAAMSPDASRMVSVGSGGVVAFWDMRKFWTSLQPRLLISNRLHQDHGRAVAYSFDGRLAASGAEDIVLWDALKMTKIDRMKYPANVMGLAFSPDNRDLVSTHADGAILSWDVAERELRASFNEHSDSVRAVAFSPDGKRVASAGEDRSVIIWNLADRRKDFVLEGHERRVTAVSFSADGGNVASCDMDGNVIVWDLAQRRSRFDFPSPKKAQDRASYCLALSPDGKWLATSFGVYDLAERRLILDYPAYEGGGHRPVYSIDFSADGRRMVCVTTHAEAMLWDVTEWKLIATRRLQNANMVSVRFSPDGRWLVTGEDQGAVRLWDTASLEVKSIIGRHSARVRSVAFSPDCSPRTCEVAAAGDDQIITLWDVNHRNTATRIGSHAAPVYAIAFSPDGKQLVSGGHDHSVRVYTRRSRLWGRRLD